MAVPAPSGGAGGLAVLPWGEAELLAQVVTIPKAYPETSGELETMILKLEPCRMGLRLCKTTLGHAEACLGGRVLETPSW